MTSEPLPERHRELLRRSRERLERGPGLSRPSLAGSPGYFYTLAATASWPLEWLVVERLVSPSDRVVAVPADTRQAAGPGDFALPATAASAPLTLRTAWAIELPAELFPPSASTGALEAELLAAVQALRSERPPRVVEEPELLGWAREVLTPALAAAEAAAQRRDPVPRRRRRPPPRTLPWMALAAGLGGCALGFFLWGLGRGAAREGAHTAAQLPSVNPGVTYLAPHGSLRAEPPPALELGATPLVVVLKLPLLDHAPAYELALLRTGETTPLWHAAAVPVLTSSEIRVLLPAHWLEAGTYRLLARPTRGDRPELSFHLEVAGPAQALP